MANKNLWTPFTRCQVVPGGGYRGTPGVMFANNRYQVIRSEGEGGMVYLSIKNNQKTAAAHDWRHFQRIKNELAGPEMEGVELYPAESRKVDGSNQYHLWCFPKGKFDFGFTERFVSDLDFPNTQQRPFESEEDYASGEYGKNVVYRPDGTQVEGRAYMDAFKSDRRRAGAAGGT